MGPGRQRGDWGRGAHHPASLTHTHQTPESAQLTLYQTLVCHLSTTYGCTRALPRRGIERGGNLITLARNAIVVEFSVAS